MNKRRSKSRWSRGWFGNFPTVLRAQREILRGIKRFKRLQISKELNKFSYSWCLLTSNQFCVPFFIDRVWTIFIECLDTWYELFRETRRTFFLCWFRDRGVMNWPIHGWNLSLTTSIITFGTLSKFISTRPNDEKSTWMKSQQKKDF